MLLIKAMLDAMRPKQWVKNVFLFAALVFARKFTEVEPWTQAILGFMAFSMVSSSGYIFNDARDREADALHPKKKFRAIASGRLPLNVAYAEMVVLFTCGLGLAFYISPWFFALALAYFINTMSYSLYFKNFVILDVMFIAMGFLWRVAAGAVAISVAPSPWLLMCTGFLSLFLGFNKRRGEIVLIKDEAPTEGSTRKNLDQYSETLVTELQAITTSGTIISYGLYTIENNQWLMLTMPHVLYGVFRYIYLVTQHNEGGAPDETLLKDKPILLTGLLYVITIFAILILTPANPV
jgi:4-hydroxybenzoate polyprenyltransferase